jgi:hypothetical protein
VIQQVFESKHLDALRKTATKGDGIDEPICRWREVERVR